MKRKKISIVVTLAILFIVIFGVYRFIHIQTRMSEPHEEDAEIATTEIAVEEPVTEEKVNQETEAEEADVQNIPADPLKSPEIEQRGAVSFDEKYTQVSGSYAVEGDAFSPFMHDIDEDGKADKIEILCEVSNNYAIESLTFQVGDLEKSISLFWCRL